MTRARVIAWNAATLLAMTHPFDDALRIAMALSKTERRRLILQLQEGLGNAEITPLELPPGLSLDDPEAIRELQRRSPGEVMPESTFSRHLVVDDDRSSPLADDVSTTADRTIDVAVFKRDPEGTAERVRTEGPVTITRNGVVVMVLSAPVVPPWDPGS